MSNKKPKAFDDLTELDHELCKKLLDTDADEWQLCFLVKRIESLEEELQELNNQRRQLKGKIFNDYDELRELVRQKIWEMSRN